jgi:hypothetical protein
MSENDIFLVGYFELESEAILAKALLEENQIRVILTGLEPSALGISLEGEEGIACYVPKQDVPRARKILAELQSDDDEAEELDIPAWTCHRCGEEVDEGFAACWNCNTDFPIDNLSPDADSDP